MSEVNTATLMDPVSEAQQAGVGRRRADKQAAAHRLRARGFSYRRIAETLRIRYDIVSRWLCGEPDAAPPCVAQPASAPPPAGEAPSHRNAMLELRLIALEAALARLQDDAARREEHLLTELGTLRAALEAATGTGGGLSRLLPWARSRERA